MIPKIVLSGNEKRSALVRTSLRGVVSTAPVVTRLTPPAFPPATRRDSASSESHRRSSIISISASRRSRSSRALIRVDQFVVVGAANDDGVDLETLARSTIGSLNPLCGSGDRLENSSGRKRVESRLETIRAQVLSRHTARRPSPRILQGVPRPRPVESESAAICGSIPRDPSSPGFPARRTSDERRRDRGEAQRALPPVTAASFRPRRVETNTSIKKALIFSRNGSTLARKPDGPGFGHAANIAAEVAAVSDGQPQQSGNGR